MEEAPYRLMQSQAVSDKLKIRSSGLSYSGRRNTFCQFFKFAQVSSGVPPVNGGKPDKNSNRMQPRDQKSTL